MCVDYIIHFRLVTKKVYCFKKNHVVSSMLIMKIEYQHEDTTVEISEILWNLIKQLYFDILTQGSMSVYSITLKLCLILLVYIRELCLLILATTSDLLSSKSQ